MSTVSKRATGYYGLAYYRDSNGKRRQKVAGVFKLKRDAKTAADELERQLDGANVDLQELSLYEYYQRWYQLYKANGITRVTQNRYKVIGGALKHYFQDQRVVDIKRSDYQAFINWYGKDHARDSVVKLNGALRACVGSAIDDDIITKDFTHNVQVVYDHQRSLRVEYLNTDEIQALRQTTAANLDRRFTGRYMILTAILTGMRKSEIQALTWKDLDYMHSTITVSKSWDEKEKGFKPAKTRASNRVIKVNRELLDLLTDLKPNGSTLVFMGQYRTVPTSNALNKLLRSIMDQAGISKQGFHFHSLRHVHVAYLLGQGVDIYAISKRLGHSNISVTLNTYSYLIDEYKAKNDDLIIGKLAGLL